MKKTITTNGDFTEWKPVTCHCVAWVWSDVVGGSILTGVYLGEFRDVQGAQAELTKRGYAPRQQPPYFGPEFTDGGGVYKCPLYLNVTEQ